MRAAGGINSSEDSRITQFRDNCTHAERHQMTNGPERLHATFQLGARNGDSPPGSNDFLRKLLSRASNRPALPGPKAHYRARGPRPSDGGWARTKWTLPGSKAPGRVDRDNTATSKRPQSTNIDYGIVVNVSIKAQILHKKSQKCNESC